MGIFFSILSPAIYGINNFIDKLILEKYEISPIVITVYSGFFGFLAGLFILAFTGFYITDYKSIAIILASGFLTNIYLIPYFKALSQDETSRVIPLFQFVPIFVLVLSFFLLGEKLNTKQYIGCAVIIASSFFLSLKKFDIKIFKLRATFWYMMLSSFLFAVSVILYKFGVQEIPFWNTLPYEGLGMALGSLSILIYRNNKKIFMNETKKFPKKIFAWMSINEGVFVLSRYTAYFALSLVAASIVNVLGGFQPFFVLIYGIILSLWFPQIIKEVVTKRTVGIKVVAVIGIFIGLSLIFL